MQQALLQAILSSLAQGVVADIRLILDRKSLAAATERFMRDRVDAMLPLVQDQLAQMLVDYPAGTAQIAAYQNNLQANGIVFEWGNPESIDGLWLAHRLALLSRRELHEQPEISLFDALARFGNRSAPIDVTDSVTGEISRAAIERWRRDTGPCQGGNARDPPSRRHLIPSRMNDICLTSFAADGDRVTLSRRG